MGLLKVFAAIVPIHCVGDMTGGVGQEQSYILLELEPKRRTNTRTITHSLRMVNAVQITVKD